MHSYADWLFLFTKMKEEKTAVDWLFLMLNDLNRNQEFTKKIYDKAKEIEKEQILHACRIGFNDGQSYIINGKTIFNSTDDYYEKTYGSI